MIGLLMWALETGAAGRVSALVYTMPFWALIFGWVFLGERIAGLQWLAAAFALAGLVLVLDPQHLGGTWQSKVLGHGLGGRLGRERDRGQVDRQAGPGGRDQPHCLADALREHPDIDHRDARSLAARSSGRESSSAPWPTTSSRPRPSPGCSGSTFSGCCPQESPGSARWPPRSSGSPPRRSNWANGSRSWRAPAWPVSLRLSWCSRCGG